MSWLLGRTPLEAWGELLEVAPVRLLPQLEQKRRQIIVFRKFDTEWLSSSGWACKETSYQLKLGRITQTAC